MSAPAVSLPTAEADDIAFDVEALRADFPILEREVDGRPLVYLDSANTSQKPRCVVEAIEDHYLNHNANVARAMHVLGAEATTAFEGGREAVASFIGAGRPEEVIFTKNASEALNLCAHTLGARLRPGDEIVISVMEHHSNIVPWQLLAERTGATLRWFDVTDEGRLDLAGAAASGLVNERTKIISVTYVSNVLGTVNPVREIVATRARGGRHRRPGRLAGRAAAAGRRGRAGRGPGRLHRAQDGRSDRHRRALGSLRPAGRAAAVPGWGRDDRGGQDDRLDLRRTAAPVRGRYAPDRPGGRVWGRPSATCQPSAWRRSPRTSRRSRRTRWRV